MRIYKCHPNIKNFVFFFQLHPVITIIVIVIIIILCQFFFSLICRLCISLIYLFLFISLGEASDYDLYFPQKTLTSYVHQSWFANLSMFTVCFWMKTDDLSEGTTFSYAIRKPCCNEITLFKRHLAIQNQNRYTSLVVVILLIRNPSQFPCCWFVFLLTPPPPGPPTQIIGLSTLVISLRVISPPFISPFKTPYGLLYKPRAYNRKFTVSDFLLLALTNQALVLDRVLWVGTGKK